MTKNVDLRLCGGTFFTLLLEARKPRYGVREHFKGDADGLSEPDALIGLAKVLVTDYDEPVQSMMTTIKGNTFDYKSCKNKGGTYFPFGNKTAVKAFDNRVKTDYNQALHSMAEFCNEFIHLHDSTKKDESLIRALIALIAADDSIVDEQKFYIDEDGSSICKQLLIKKESFCVQSFLLGVLHFVVCRTEAASIGKETYNTWCPPKGGGTRIYEGHIGEGWLENISLFSSNASEEVEESKLINETVEDAGYDNHAESNQNNEKPVPQMNFNFNVTGDNNSFYNHVDTVNNYHGGRKDGK